MLSIEHYAAVAVYLVIGAGLALDDDVSGGKPWRRAVVAALWPLWLLAMLVAVLALVVLIAVTGIWDVLVTRLTRRKRGGKRA